MNAAAYTPLESLLLFQALRADGVQHVDFNKIASDLRRIPLVTCDASYDPSRLAPDALRDLYLGLLKEEAKADLERQLARDDAATHVNGNASPSSRKRKAPSPSLPTVREAAQHAHLIPKLVARLYARYRENVVEEIREHETRYDAAVSEREEIRSGKLDAKLLRERASTSPKPSSAAHTQPALVRRDFTQASATNSPTSARASAEPAAPQRYSQAKIDAVINHGPEPQDHHGHHRRNSSSTALPPLSEMAPQSPRFGIPPRLPSNHGGQSALQPAPYSPHHGHPPSAMGSPHLHGSLSRPSSSPRPILPPPPGMTLAPSGQLAGSPNMHGPTPNAPYQQQYPHSQQYGAPHRMSTGAMPAHDWQHRGYPTTHAPPLPPTPQGYYQPQQQPYADRRTPYQSQGQPAYPPPSQHAGGRMLPPFQVSQQDPANAACSPLLTQQYIQRNQQTPQYPHRTQSYPHPAPSTAPRLQTQPNQRLVSEVIAALATPPRLTARPLWKSERKPRPSQPPGSPTAPAVEPMSPPKRRAPSPMPLSQFSTSSRDQRSDKKVREAFRELSRASSTAEGSRVATRSQSVSSQTSRPQKDFPKSSPSATAQVSSSPATATAKRASRRNTLIRDPPSTTVSKRKRASPLPATPLPPQQRTHIMATRNLGRMSATLIADLQGHKHGSRFAHPVRAKDAEGYTDIIKQPQDLKSIRAAISAGSRAVTALAPADSDATAGVVEIPRGDDVLPPRGIVNGAQLEKEVLRMLANAVMFNPGEDGMVADTREMFEDVEERVREWRGAEREVVEGGGTATSATADDGAAADAEEEGRGKRRKF